MDINDQQLKTAITDFFFYNISSIFLSEKSVFTSSF